MAGNDPTKNPDLSGDYFYLIDEYGENFFNDESGSFFIHKEEDK